MERVASGYAAETGGTQNGQAPVQRETSPHPGRLLWVQEMLPLRYREDKSCAQVHRAGPAMITWVCWAVQGQGKEGSRLSLQPSSPGLQVRAALAGMLLGVRER